ncbi:MAG: metallopeptidase family protein [Actinomycetaceae bacterium]|nr:metallopeptidase family protein [Actinomycetaceae bacterium]
MRRIIRRRDRHARGSRGPLFPPGIPARLTWRDSFAQLVALNVEEIISRHPNLAAIEVAIDEVPPSDPASWEPHELVLCRTFPGNRFAGLKARIVLYRLPIHSRAGRGSMRDGHSPLQHMIRVLLVEGYVELTGMLPEQVAGEQ